VADIISLISIFAPLFLDRVWVHAQILLIGALVAPGTRTVTSVLRVMGRSAEMHFTNFHRVLNRAQWSTRQGVAEYGIIYGVEVPCSLKGWTQPPPLQTPSTHASSAGRPRT